MLKKRFPNWSARADWESGMIEMPAFTGILIFTYPL